MNDEQLKEQLENLKKGEYIYLSNWYGGKNKSGYNGYLVNFVDNSIYEFESIGTYTNTLTTEATLNKITTFPVELKTIFALYIKNEKLFYFDNIDKLVFDMGTSIEVSLGNVKSKIMNADKTCSNGRICVYDDLKAIIEEIINTQTKTVDVSSADNEVHDDEEALKKTIEEIVGNNDPYWNKQVYDIVKKIIDLPIETITTIADLINYNPNEKFVDPLTQGRISFWVKEICKKLNIQLEHNKDKIGGLAYYYQFKKTTNKEME